MFVLRLFCIISSPSTTCFSYRYTLVHPSNRVPPTGNFQLSGRSPLSPFPRGCSPIGPVSMTCPSNSTLSEEPVTSA
ncbi:hypothetical protein HOY80DRAFT_960571 [Tuber brumale]|nr:hypothetical protein HOY80DRAFT_960571 [Tuber brumale]